MLEGMDEAGEVVEAWKRVEQAGATIQALRAAPKVGASSDAQHHRESFLLRQALKKREDG